MLHLKDVLCKSVDMILDQNLSVLEQESHHDKKLIQTFVEESDRNKLSFSHLVRTSEEIECSGDDFELLTLGGAICRQIGFCKNSCFQSGLKIQKLLFRTMFT